MSFAVALAALASAGFYVVAKVYGWYENIGLSERFVWNTLLAGAPLMVSALFPGLILWPPRWLSNLGASAMFGVAVASWVWFMVAGVWTLMLSGGF